MKPLQGIDHEANGGGGGSEESTEESGAPEGPEATTDGLAKLIRVLKQVISTNIRHLPFTSTK